MCSSVGNTFFIDAGCTIPAVATAATIGCVATTPKYLSVPSPPPTMCPAVPLGPKYYQLGTTSTTYYSKSGTTCVIGNLPGYTFHGIGTEIAPTDFVEMTTVQE